MPHSFPKIWIHAIWTTKERAPLISANIEQALYDFMALQFKESGCHLHAINGVADHVHCLFLLSAQKAVADVIKQVKGSSSHFINQGSFLTTKFAWQTGYAALSVSESGVGNVTKYIANQKQHHQKQTFEQEYQAFLKLHGFSDNVGDE